MSFLINSLIRSFLTQQAVDLVQREVTTQVERELRVRQEAAIRAASIRDGKAGVVDLAIIFSQPHEAVGLLDRFPDTALTRGNGNMFYTFVHREKHVVAALPGDDSRENLEQVTHAVIDIFRPRRVISAGFAAGIAPGVSLLSFYVPNMLIDGTGRETIDLRQVQLSAPQVNAVEMPSDAAFSEDIDSQRPKKSTVELLDSRFRVGTIVTTRRPLYTPAQKLELRKHYAAQLADRSAFAVLDVCRRRCVPVLPIRIVTSQYDEELPRDVKAQTLGAHPARRFGALLGNLMRRPGSVIDTLKQKQRHLEASDALAGQIMKLLFR